MARIFLALNCCMLFAILCLFSEVIECKKVSRRRDVHRIILKEKNRNRPKKHAHPPLYHNEFSRGPFENSYNPSFEQIGEYTNHHVRYHNRNPGSPSYYEPPHNYHQNFEKYPTPYPDFNFRPHTSDAEISANRQHHHHVMDIEEFNKHQDDYKDNLKDSYNGKFPGDYDRYKQLMEHYNNKNEEQFRIKVENSKQNPYAEENLSAMATHNFPIAWHPQNSDNFKGSWNPVSTLGTLLETKYTNKIKEFPHQNIEDIIELTTSKAYLLPSMIVETNLTKHKTTNFNLDHSVPNIYHSNHKYPRSKPGEIYSSKYRNKNFKNGSYQVHEENGDSGVSSVLGSFQNLAPAASTSSYSVVRKPEKFVSPDDTTFGVKTKSRRTKRPASSIK